MSGRPFSEPHHRWLKSRSVHLTRESGAAISESLYWNRVEQLRESIHPLPPGTPNDPKTGFAHLTLEFLPNEPDSPVYLSLAIIGPGKPLWPTMAVRRVELTPAEVVAVAEALPILGSEFGPPQPGTSPGERVTTAIAAKVSPIPDQDAGLILCPRNLWISTFWGFVPLALGLTAGAAAGVVAANYGDELGTEGFVAVIVAGSVALLGSFVWLGLFADYLPARYLHGCACRVVRDRPDPVVLPDDPGAFFVQIIPRKNWGRVMLENAEDVGFMLFDESRGVILYEGDRERWVVPRESVISCELEGFDIGLGDPNAGPAFWMVILKANVGGQVWEVSLAPRLIKLRKWTATTRRLAAEGLRDDIRRVLDESSSPRPDLQHPRTR